MDFKRIEPNQSSEKPGSSTRKTSTRRKQRGLALRRFFTTPGVDPADEIAWERRSAAITGDGGETIFEQKDIETRR